MRMTTLWVLLIALALPLACSRAQETADEAASTAAEAADAVAATAEDAADAVADAAGEAKQATTDVAAAAAGAVEEVIDDPVAKCKELAEQGAWSEALEPCTKAHQAQPDDLAIEHALQQAQAAAAE
jgi:hypothetical protein